jgi:hypothetical protein
MNSTPATQAQKLTEFSLRLSQAVEADCAEWRLPAWLVALIVAFIKEIAESLAELAKLLREGKLNLQPPAPRQGIRRPATRASAPGMRTGRSHRTPRPAGAAVPLQVPTADPQGEPPAAPERIERPAGPLAHPRPLRPRAIAWACGPPTPILRFSKHLRWHAHIITLA